MKIETYDTTLRDGAQGEGISFSLEDKINIALKLDELGIDYIEGGWPGSNPKDILFFKEIKKFDNLSKKICAFGSTRHVGTKLQVDKNLNSLLQADTSIITIFGKSWLLHVNSVLKTTPQENLKMISETIKYLKDKGKIVFYDAEHFFDGYKDNSDYALKTLKNAVQSGAKRIILCDTNGGTLPFEIEEIFLQVKKVIDVPLGIHCHNDCGLAVANSLSAVRAGAIQVQGTINGYGERCGNADLVQIIPNLQLKLNYELLTPEQLKKLTLISRYVNEIANLVPQSNQPFVGKSAFAHKGGIHVNAVGKITKSYEHIDPELVGNSRKVLVSELSGKSNILFKAREFGIELKEKEEIEKLLSMIKENEKEGYEFEGAEASFYLFIIKMLKKQKKFFQLEKFKVTTQRINEKLQCFAEVSLKVKGKREKVVSEGNGPVNALDNALRKCLENFYPILKKVYLIDYKVRVIEGKSGTASRVRVLIESSDGEEIWRTVGVSENIIEASWEALIDSIEYKLLTSKNIS